jgi:hypothetical protein
MRNALRAVDVDRLPAKEAQIRLVQGYKITMAAIKT